MDDVTSREPSAQRRIHQLLAQRHEIKLQAEYLGRVTLMLMHLVPKQAVAQILRAAKSPSDQKPNRGARHHG